jgi:hypothetical protein
VDPLQLFFLILAAVLFGLATFGIGAPRANLGWAGALSFTLATLLPALMH